MSDEPVSYCKKCFHPEVNHVGAVGCALDECECTGWELGEIRVTSANGASKGTKDARYDLIPIPALDALARLYGFGAKKYAAHNWRLGYDWSLSYAAAQRHMNAFWAGEDIDPESGAPHVINAAFHMFALATFLTEHPELDDRFETRESRSDAEEAANMFAYNMNEMVQRFNDNVIEKKDVDLRTIVRPQKPTYNPSLGEIYIPSGHGANYYEVIGNTRRKVSGVLNITRITNIEAEPRPGFVFEEGSETSWSYLG